MSTTTHHIDLSVRVKITIEDGAPDDILSRGQDPEWYGAYYGKMTNQQVLDHLAEMALYGYEDVEQIDGFADAEKGTVKLVITHVDPE